MEAVYVFITIAVAVISIILFIKIWMMTENVEQIKNHLCQDEDFETKFNFLIAIGEKEKAKEYLIAYILSDKDIFVEHKKAKDETKLKLIAITYGDALKAVGIDPPKSFDHRR